MEEEERETNHLFPQGSMENYGKLKEEEEEERKKEKERMTYLLTQGFLEEKEVALKCWDKSEPCRGGRRKLQQAIEIERKVRIREVRI